jgi:isopentenyl-diphosphate delta-isomerase
MEELGFDCDLKLVQSFIYKAPFDNGLTEHELDHIFKGNFEGEIVPNPEEVSDLRWVEPNQLLKEIERSPEQFTVWFKMILSKVTITA